MIGTIGKWYLHSYNLQLRSPANLARLNIFTKGDSRTFMISVKRVQFIFAWDFAAVLIIGVSAMRDLTVSTRKKPRTSRNK